MNPATEPREPRDAVRLLVIDPQSGRLDDRRVTDLPSLLLPGDLLVVNDAATLPASIRARWGDVALELRLTGPPQGNTVRVVLFRGCDDWRTPTEQRMPPPRIPAGAHLVLAGGVSAEVVARATISARLVTLRFDNVEQLWSALYAHGAPIQYSYLSSALSLASTQTLFAARPWAVELPSAGRPLSWSIMAALKQRGIAIKSLTHAAGISATGDEFLDSRLPLPERYELPAATADAVNATRARGGRVVAVGTSVVRALESATDPMGVARPSRDVTSLRIGPCHDLRGVDALLTGMHEPGESHFELATAFADRTLLERAVQHAADRGYLCHEFGDLTLVLPAQQPARRGHALSETTESAAMSSGVPTR
jgi:S-adenosylmethionine:tRNA ribosyltransferase-isomerase